MPDAKDPNPDEQDERADLKAKMREALDRKKSHGGINPAGRAKEKAHGSEVSGGAAPKMHRRKAGGGGA